MKGRIAIVIPYFGELPDITAYFLESVRCSPEFTILLITDARNVPYVPVNVRVYRSSLDNFNTRASSRLGINTQITTPYKVCDFKPTFGILFEDLLSEYEFWGFGDLDVVWGRLFNFVGPLLDAIDIISFRAGWITGSLCILRNCPLVNDSFKESLHWKRALMAAGYVSFDELGGPFFNAVLNGANLSAVNSNIESFTHIIHRLRRNGTLRCSFTDLACEQLLWGETLRYNEGSLTRLAGGSEIAYLHSVIMKRRFFGVPTVKAVPSEFWIKNTGIYTNTPSEPVIELGRILRGTVAGASRLARHALPLRRQ